VLTARRLHEVLLIAAVATGPFLLGSSALAGPQDDPPPVQVTAGGPLLAGDTGTVTLTLDSAGHAGDLEPGAIQAAKQVAATVNAGPGSGADQGDTTGGGGSPSPAADPGSGSAVSSGECSWRDASWLPPTADAWGGNDPAAGTLLVNICNGPERFLFVPNAAPGAPAAAAPPPPPPPDPAVLAQQAYGELTLPKPAAKRSPDEGNSDPQNGGLSYTWINLWTYVWVGEWQSLARTVDLRGVSATVTATPTALVFDPGDGAAPVTCEGPGRPWTAADGSSPPSAGGCGYMYRAVTPNGPLTATTSIRWSVAWTSNVGAAGTFPVLTSQSASSFLVEQIQVVTR
jgi:hypothetical protein